MEIELHASFESDVDGVEADKLTHELRQQVLDCEVDDARLVQRAVSAEGAKSVDVTLLGGLVVTLTPPVLAALTSVARSWIKNKPIRKLKITIGGDCLEIEGTGSNESERAMKAFLERHSRP